MENEIYLLIRSLGVSSKYKGYQYMADALKLWVETQGEQLTLTKDIYHTLAKKYHSSPSCIEHNIRTVVTYCWRNSRPQVEQILGYTPDYRPTNYEFLDGLAFYLIKKGFPEIVSAAM